MNGKICRVLVDKNFGFIAAEDGNEYFFHKSSLQNERSFTQRLVGLDVTFEDTDTSKGLRAEQVFLEQSA